MIGEVIEAGKDIFDSIMNVIDKLIPDPKQAADAKLKLLELQQQGALSQIEAQSRVVVAEAQSESWLARNWRPITMLTFVSIIANNYLFAPYMMAFGFKSVMLQLPEHLWYLMEIGLGGYIIGRSMENGVKVWKSNQG